jgi:hypothetical protein
MRDSYAITYVFTLQVFLLLSVALAIHVSSVTIHYKNHYILSKYEMQDIQTKPTVYEVIKFVPGIGKSNLGYKEVLRAQIQDLRHLIGQKLP